MERWRRARRHLDGRLGPGPQSPVLCCRFRLPSRTVDNNPAPHQGALSVEVVDDRADENGIGSSRNHHLEFPHRRPEPVLPACVIAVDDVEHVGGEIVPVTFVDHLFATVPGEPAHMSGKRAGTGL